MDGNILLAFSLTLFAGLATGIGSILAFFVKTTNKRFLSFALGLAAGVMIYVSMAEIFFEAQESLVNQLGEIQGSWVTAISFFAGMLLIGFIDRVIPQRNQTYEGKTEEEIKQASLRQDNNSLLKTGTFTALAIAIHNFPEGIATFIATLQDPALGVPIAIAIAIHNIPEGIAISVPIYYATGSRKKAFRLSFLSGLAEPAGAVIAYLLLMPFLSETLFGIIFASVAGIMVFISLDELIPQAKRYDEDGHMSMYGVISGMAVMALSLLLML